VTSLADFELRDGVFVQRGGAGDEYRARWEAEAADDPVRSATARRGAAGDDGLSVKISEFWRRFPRDRRVPAVLELGCGYGRIPLYLARERGLSFERYVGVDISETMLRHFRRHVDEAGGLGAKVDLVCASIHRLPLEDDSVDLALSHAVLLHMGKRFVAESLRELARVLRPGGGFALDVAFPNRACPANLPGRLGGLVPFREVPNRMKYWSRREVEELLAASGVASKQPDYAVEPVQHRLVPTTVGRFGVPLSERLNAALTKRPTRLGRFAVVSYRAASRDLAARG
jgi:SAM-dependent methyltransferase